MLLFHEGREEFKNFSAIHLLLSCLQNDLAREAVAALAELHGTKYTYGSTIDTICKWFVFQAGMG